MKKATRRIIAFMMVVICLLGGCGTTGYEENQTLTYNEAIEELSSKLTKVNSSTVDAPLDIYDLDTTVKTLADIDTYPLTVHG